MCVSTQERQMSRFTCGQLCRVTVEVLANILDQYEQKGKNGRSGGLSGKDEATIEDSKTADRHKKAGLTCKRGLTEERD